MSNHRLQALLHITSTLGWDEPATALNAKVLDTTADLAVILDHHEHARRQTQRAGALTDFDLAMFLMSLPLREPVPLCALSTAERAQLSAAPCGALVITDESVTRLASPPTRAVLAVVYDDHARSGLRRASQFAPVAARVLVLPEPPSAESLVLAEAAEYGIGVCSTGSGGGIDMHVSPVPWRQHYFTAGGWLFKEQCYRLVTTRSP
ncbi:hypothetical protein [Mycobacteroides abscessus]|uniref:hypothetical protein n=1 Tax=Mycobacteroides abscessus TaxID=36809 RepID=UPI000C25E97A|nr:hypothetical protein [Mycobacteroides abscessus]